MSCIDSVIELEDPGFDAIRACKFNFKQECLGLYQLRCMTTSRYKILQKHI